MSVVRGFLGLSVVGIGIASTAACGPSVRGGDGCSSGDHRCTGLVYERCELDHWVTEEKCPTGQACSAELGCTECTPGGTGCQGNSVVVCDASGSLTGNVVADCGAEVCADGECVPPCSPQALQRSNLGCVYYALDLPQWGQDIIIFNPYPVAAIQQFAIAVANPWDHPIEVVVDRNDGAPGAPPFLVEVTRMTIAASSLVAIPLPQREVNDFVHQVRDSRSAHTAAAYRVTTNYPSTVYQFNPQNSSTAFSNDASLLIPVSSLDESYLVLGWPGAGGFREEHPGFPVQKTDQRPYISIVGVASDTRVRIVPSTPTMAGEGLPARTAGEEIVATLQPFEVLTLEGADFYSYGLTDFTGTRIEADQPVAVFSGVECAFVRLGEPPERGCCCDHMEEQIFPRSSLGNDYVVVRSEPRRPSNPEPDVFRLIGLGDGTEVVTSLAAPNDAFALGRGEMREIVTTRDFVVTTNQPIMIGQFLVSQDLTAIDVENDDGKGDPSFNLVPPVSQFRTRYLFLVPRDYEANHILLSVPAGVTPTLDGATLGGCTRAMVGEILGRPYEALRCPVGEGSHEISADQAFGIVVEGWGPGPVSYAYTGGMDFEPVSTDCLEDTQCPGGEFCSGGVCVPVID